MEYDADALAREYRRDVRRFMVAETDRFPEAPVGCFPPAIERLLVDFRTRALESRDLKLLADIPLRIPATSKEGPWRSVAIQFYRNWLAHLANRQADKDAEAAGDAQGSRQPASAQFC